jgi:hypothetical protein
MNDDRGALADVEAFASRTVPNHIALVVTVDGQILARLHATVDESERLRAELQEAEYRVLH